MSYDGNNAYPEKPKPVVKQQIGRQTASEKEDSLGRRTINALSSCRKGMDILQRERREFMQFYMGGPIGNEIKGHSQVVMTDVADTVESLMPDMMRIFMGGKGVVQVSPVGPEDEEKSKLMEEKINFDVEKQNDGFVLLHTFIKDALIDKMGVIKYSWERKTESKKRHYRDLTDEELAMLTQKPGTQITKTTSFIMENGKKVNLKDSTQLEDVEDYMVFHDVTFREITERISRPKLENLPPEEFIFNITGRNIANTFCAHKKKVHKNYLKRFELTDEDIQEQVDKVSIDGLEDERFKDLGGTSFITDDKEGNHVFIYECYINDYDEEGDIVPKKVLLFGDRVLSEEDNSYKRPPFVVASPILMSHRLCGRSYAEILLEIQKLRTALVRYILDNIYYQNNAMKVVNPYRIDLDSLLNSNKPGGIALTKYDTDPNDAIFNIPTTEIAPHALKMLEYVEGPVKENRTGVSRYSQGMDASSLNDTATGITQIMSAAAKRTELLARVLAETGIKELYRAIVEMNIDYYDIETNLKINQDWQLVRPEDLDGKFDVNIEVGSSTGTKEMQYQQKVQMLNIYMMILRAAGPAAQKIYTIENVKNLIKNMWEDLGVRNTDLYVAPDQKGGQGGQGAGIGGIGAAGGGEGEGATGGGVAGQPAIQQLLQAAGGGVS